MLTGPSNDAISGNTKRLVIFLHGYGSNGDDLISLVPYFAQIDPDADFVSPNAPESNPFSPGGYQWFPIPYIDGSSEQAMLEGLKNAHQALLDFITAELSKRNLNISDLVLIGFSQGTMMSLHAALRLDAACAGVIGFSGRLMRPESLERELRAKPPIILIHGANDDVVPASASVEARQKFEELELDAQLHISPNTPHSIAMDGLQAALKFYQSKIMG